MNSKAGTADLLVVGGGIIGLSAAWEVARRGYRVTVLERATVAGESTWAAAGMLSPLGEAATGGPMLDFGKASLSAYTDWIEGIEAGSGASVDYRRDGKLQVALVQGDVEALRSLARVGTSAGVSCTWLEAPEVRRIEPAVTADALGALYVVEDGAVDSRALGAALAQACRAEGIEVREGTRVRGVDVEDGAVRGVLTEDGCRLAGGAVLVAAGAWSGQLEGLPRPLPEIPIRGQMLVLLPTAPPSNRILGQGHVYIVPRSDGRILVGATMEEAGFEKANTREGLIELREGASELVPSLAAAPIVERWSGLRPGSRDGLPLIGPDLEVANLFYATGHYRNGILLAPVTGRVVADLFETGASPLLPREFRPDRFRTGA